MGGGRIAGRLLEEVLVEGGPGRVRSLLGGSVGGTGRKRLRSDGRLRFEPLELPEDGA